MNRLSAEISAPRLSHPITAELTCSKRQEAGITVGATHPGYFTMVAYLESPLDALFMLPPGGSGVTRTPYLRASTGRFTSYATEPWCQVKTVPNI